MVMLNSALHRDAVGYWHWCPGCEAMHCMPITGAWTFTGKPADLSASPSFQHSRMAPGMAKPVNCHYVLTLGIIEFKTCSHALSGKSVPLPDIPAGQIEALGLDKPAPRRQS